MDIYVVKNGDTIDTIANRFGVSVNQLIRDNELTNPYNLIPGEVIVIANPSQIYTVQEGDTKEAIAASFNISVNELLRNNPIISNMGYVYPGEVLYISYNRSARITTYGYANTFIDRQLLRKTLPFLTYLSIFNYLIDKNGNAYGSNNDMDMIRQAMEYGVIPLMHLATITVQGEPDLELTYEILSNEELQDILFENVINILRVKGYHGIIISAQYITSENQNLFYNYTKRFSDWLSQEGFLTFIAINPQIKNVNDEVIFEDIDYSSISSVVNSVIFLQYTWGIVEGPPSPVISVSDLNVFLDYAQPQIESDKIVIGIPTIGYIWEIPYEAGLSSSNSITLDNALNLARDVGANIQFDQASQNPYFFYENQRNADEQYIVWFVNAITVDALERLILERGISAIGVWNVMSFFADLWLVINSQYEIIKLLPEF